MTHVIAWSGVIYFAEIIGEYFSAKVKGSIWHTYYCPKTTISCFYVIFHPHKKCNPV